MSEPIIQLVLGERIHRNWDINPRPKNEQFIDDLSEIIAKDGYNKEKYCIAFEIEGRDKLELGCGHHRFEANKKAGNTEIWCEVREGTMSDLIETMCADNQQFDPTGNPELGQLWTGTEKREAGKLRLLLPKYFSMSDRELAPIFGVDHHSTVGRWRADVVNVAIATPDNPLNIEEPRLTELRELVAKREVQNKNRSEAQSKHLAVEKFYESHKAFQSAVSDFVALPSNSLDFTYCRRRIVAHIRLQDTGDAKKWELETIQSQTQVREEAAAVIREKTANEDTSHIFEEGSLAELLHEIKLIAKALERYTVLRPPQLRQPLDARTPVAVKKLEAIFTAEWEAQPSADCRSEVIRLIELQPVLYKSECFKRDNETDNRNEKPPPAQPAIETPEESQSRRAIEKEQFELQRARENTKAAASELKTAWGLANFNCKYSHFLEFISQRYDFDLQTLRAICFTMSIADALTTFNNLSIGELGTWRSRLNNLKGAIERKDPAFDELRERSPEDELQQAREAYVDAHTDMWQALRKSQYSEYIEKDDFITAACKPFKCQAFPDSFNLHTVEQLQKWRERVETLKSDIQQEADGSWFMALVDKSRQAILDTVSQFHQAQNRIYDVWSHDDIIRDQFETVEEFHAVLIKDRGLWTGIFNRVDPENLERPLHEIRWHITKLETLANDLENEADWVVSTFYKKAEVDETTLKGAGAEPVKSEKLDLWEQVNAEIPKWKQRHKGQGIGHASKTMLLEASWKMLHTDDFPRGAAAGEEHLKFLLMYLQDDDADFLARVCQKLDPTRQSEPSAEAPNWSRIRSLLSEVNTEFASYHLPSVIDTLEAQIQDILETHFPRDNESQLAVLAKIMLKYMQQIDEQLSNPNPYKGENDGNHQQTIQTHAA